jgi:hypothetical protein
MLKPTQFFLFSYFFELFYYFQLKKLKKIEKVEKLKGLRGKSGGRLQHVKVRFFPLATTHCLARYYGNVP